MKNKLVLIGGGGYCSGVLDTLKKLDTYELVGITDPVLKIGSLVSSVPVLGDDTILEDLYHSGIHHAHITVGSIADCILRKKLIAMAEKIGFELVSIIDPSATLAQGIQLGTMTYIAKNVAVNANVAIGDYCILNTGSIVEHGCNLGNYTHVAPGSVLAGDVCVGNETHFGLNCSILQGLSIGSNVIIGAGSTVLRNIKDNETVVGIVK